MRTHSGVYLFHSIFIDKADCYEDICLSDMRRGIFRKGMERKDTESIAGYRGNHSYRKCQGEGLS